MPRRKPLPEPLGPSFSIGQARAAGVTRGRLASSDLEIPFRGVRAVSQEAPVPATTSADHFAQRRDEFLRLCRAYVHVAPADFRFSGTTAARIYQIPLPQELEHRLELDVAVARSEQRPRRRGIVGHRLVDLSPTVIREGLPVLPPERVWLQLAPLLELDELIVAGDHLVRRKRPDTTIERLADGVAAAGAVPGIGRAREALQELRPGTESPKESALRLVIVRAGLPEPVVGFEVRDAHGQFVGLPDLAYPREKVALDFEGDVHRTDDRTFRRDIERQERFEDAAWRRIRVTKDHLRSPRHLLERIARQLRERG